jgi:hypothetical protein
MLRTLTFTAFGLLVPSAQADDLFTRHPRLHAALAELREARRELRDCRDDFGGRRDKALAAIDDAVASLKGVLRVKGDDFRGLDRTPDYYKQFGNFPRCRAAIKDLREAREELRDAKADFGDLRERALRDVDLAIAQLRGMFDERR